MESSPASHKGNTIKPQIKIAEKVLPPPLWRALNHVFAQGISGRVLAGGTALAGFYSGHRRSDDLDIFTKTQTHQRAATLAVKSLSSMGATVNIFMETQQYFEANCSFEGHLFKVTVVTDQNLFRLGENEFCKLKGDLQVIDLETLFKMKAATLARRCSEKDLYDLIWLFGKFSNREISDLIALGNEIDSGVESEAMLLSVEGAILRKEACDFALNPPLPKEKVYAKISQFREELLRGLLDYSQKRPAPALGELIKNLRNLE